ncbi:hypothetical protein OVN20_11750 [Microcella daejeonensis]|uniref:hypothetical protein n=1 Tax=Microcella daejeonensis TaxID=2994971 RepID=UPI0022713C0C|nr:hypothetical protein [Microcella daejeonensis]WAB83703.1 hypothetical protein OVN20_11750 [Microcella daejeonensis]
MPARRRARSAVGVPAIAVVAVVAAGLLAGCAAQPGGRLDASLAELNRERDAVALAAHEADTERFGVYLRDRWGPISVPETSSYEWVAADEWAAEVSRCLDDRGFPGARPTPEGDRIDYGRVAVVSTRDLYELDVAAFGCQAEHPVREWYSAELQSVEAPWALDYWQTVLAPCLRSHGYRAAPVPRAEEFAETWRTDGALDPYRLVGPGPLERTAAEARCPAPETLLDAVP